MTPAVSVIVRAKDRAHTIEKALESVRAQDTEAELIVVDSGSVDGTVAIARRYADQVIEIPASEFTYGGALNTGAEAAGGQVHIALSAHCELPDTQWIGRAAAHFDDPAVAGVTGTRFGPRGELLAGPARKAGDPSDDRNIYWGYSNHAGCWRAEAWEHFPFSTELIACEDKDWEHRVRRAGMVVVIDPSLEVGATHRRREGSRALWGRARREGAAIQTIIGGKPITILDVVRQWATLEERPALPQLANPYRIVDIAGRYVGARKASRQ